MEIAFIIFLVTYILMLVIPRFKVWIALTSAILFLILNFVQITDVFSIRMNWNVFLILIGTMLMVEPFIQSGMPAFIANRLVKKQTSSGIILLSLSFFAAIVSAFVDNVATVLIIAPIAIDVAKRAKLSPVPFILSIAMFANLQGFATLVGDTTSIMLAGYLNMSFFDFFFVNGTIGPFFIVQVGTLLALLVLWLIVHKFPKVDMHQVDITVKSYTPTIILLSTLFALVIVSFIDSPVMFINGYITLIGGLTSVIVTSIQFKKNRSIHQFLQGVDLETLLLLFGIFVLILGLENQGVIADFADFIANSVDGNIFVVYTVIVFVSVLFSAFIDTIPYVAAMLPLVALMSEELGISGYLLMFGLLAGSTLGGNLTPIGASANIVGVGLLKKQGIQVRFSQFLKLGIPVTLAAVLSGYVMIWFLFS
jgi:Na+/H+ antiporter NhaD/arsenite permease-like protein